MKKPIYDDDYQLNTSNSVCSSKSGASRYTSRTTSSQMTTRTAPVSTSLFSRLAQQETYASAKMKGKIDAEPAPRSSGKTTNSFFDRLAKEDTFASANMKGTGGNSRSSKGGKADDAFFERMSKEDTYASSSMKGNSQKGKTEKKSPKTSSSNRQGFFDRLSQSDTFASATYKGKIEADSGNSPAPSSKKHKTNLSFFDRLSKTETKSSRNKKICYGTPANDEKKNKWNSSQSMGRPQSARPQSARPQSARPLSAKSSRLSSTLRKSTPKSTGLLSRKTLFSRKKSITPGSDVLSPRKTPIRPRTPKPKAEISISKLSLSFRSGGSVKSTSSAKSRSSVVSSRSVKSRSSVVSSRSVKSKASTTSRTSMTSATSRTSRTSATSDSNRSLSKARLSTSSGKSWDSPRKSVKRSVTPKKAVAPLIFDSDDDMSFGDDDSEDEADILSTRSTPKETDSVKENTPSPENIPDAEINPPPKVEETTPPVKDLVMAGNEDDPPLLENDCKPLTTPELPEERSVPQDKPVLNDSMMSYDTHSVDKEDDADLDVDLDDLLGAAEDKVDESFQSESNRDDLPVVQEEAPQLQEEQKITEDIPMDTATKVSKFKLLCSDKYHPERGMQELDAGELDLVDQLVSFESNGFSNEDIAVLIIEALFRRDFKDSDGDQWDIDPGTARELEDDESEGRDLDGRGFVVKQQARWDSDKNYSVAAAKGIVTIWPDLDEIRMENYSYFVAG
eukprot:CAMPEP_0198276678 /NCGR_PEP_ID=MMETSP1447-20131203/65440_1 /TAXON_ID=420782 /ORGANISM="Chaetoceros dichaeta, Strain CCMP1751" /LENGTH=732 /DNA_ID=CAMNT_0043971639 /DNA_START=144 /DNA_END=2342 /DNA_ORIENTATION=-